VNYLDLLPDDLIEIINKKLIEAQNKERRKIRKETKRAAKQYKFCEKLLKKTYSKYNNILDYEFCIGEEITYIKANFIDSRFNEFVTILMAHSF
jgi:hypothetical protein